MCQTYLIYLHEVLLEEDLHGSLKPALPAPTRPPRNHIPPQQGAALHPPCSAHSAHPPQGPDPSLLILPILMWPSPHIP